MVPTLVPHWWSSDGASLKPHAGDRDATRCRRLWRGPRCWYPRMALAFAFFDGGDDAAVETVITEIMQVLCRGRRYLENVRLAVG
jgi:hypothetical protein